MRSWVKKENDAYHDFFARSDISFQKLRDSFSEYFSDSVAKEAYLWDSQGSTFALLKDHDGRGYSIWKRSGECVPEFVLDYTLPTPKSTIIKVVPSPNGTFTLLVIANRGSESNSVQIFDCQSHQFIGLLIKNVSASPVFLIESSQFYAIQHDRLYRPKRLVRIDIDRERNCKLRCLAQDSDPHFFYRLVPWCDQKGLLFIGKSITAVKICCLSDTSSEYDKLSIRNFYFDCGTTLAAADSSSLFIALNNDEGANLFKTHPSNSKARLCLTWMNKTLYFIYALGQTSQYVFMILNKGPSFSLLAVHRDTGKRIDGRVPKQFRHGHLSVIQTETEHQVLIQVQSITQPQQLLRWDLDTGEVNFCQKSTPIRDSDVSAELQPYETKLTFTASDGVEVPISLAFIPSHPRLSARKMTRPPALVYVYGCYGRLVVPDYSPFRYRLIQSGAIYVVIHVRGGGEFGPQWHRQGMGQNKERAVLDLLEGVEWLITKGYIDQHNVVGCGRSAAGILFALAINLRPILFRALVLESPFLDLFGCMAQPEQALAVAEDVEWTISGDESYQHLRRLCPIKTISRQPYPDVLIQCGICDWRTPVTQIRRWLDAIRSNSTNRTTQIVWVCEDSGHQLQKDLGRLTEWYYFVLVKMGLLPL